MVNNWLCQYFSLSHKTSSMCDVTIYLFNHLNRQELKNIAIVFTHTIKMLSRPTYIFVGFDIGFMYSKTTLEISSRTNILFQAVLTGYQIDNIITITMKEPYCIISSIGNTACEIITTYYINFSNVTFVTTSDRISSINFIARV